MHPIYIYILVIHTPGIEERGLVKDQTHTLEQYVTLAFHISYKGEQTCILYKSMGQTLGCMGFVYFGLIGFMGFVDSNKVYVTC